MLPTRILRLLEFVGFSGNKVTASLWVPSVSPVQGWSWARHSGAEGPWGLVPILAELPLCVALGKSLDLSEPQPSLRISETTDLSQPGAG